MAPVVDLMALGVITGPCFISNPMLRRVAIYSPNLQRPVSLSPDIFFSFSVYYGVFCLLDDTSRVT